MKEEYMLRLLHIIDNNLAVDELIDLGLTYSQISTFIAQATEDNLIDRQEATLILTSRGKTELKKLQTKIFPRLKKTWILPDDKFRIRKRDVFDIYLPKKK